MFFCHGTEAGEKCDVDSCATEFADVECPFGVRVMKDPTNHCRPYPCPKVCLHIPLSVYVRTVRGLVLPLLLSPLQIDYQCLLFPNCDQTGPPPIVHPPRGTVVVPWALLQGSGPRAGSRSDMW